MSQVNLRHAARGGDKSSRKDLKRNHAKPSKKRNKIFFERAYY